MDIVDQLVLWIRERVEEAGAGGAVFGLSGGLDSSVAGILCGKAMGEGSLGVIMPCHSNPEDLRDATTVADKFEIPTIIIDLGPVFDSLIKVLPSGSSDVISNIKPRLRMTTLYYLARDKEYLVVGTGNKSEVEVGYFTKYGDGGADIFPLAGIYKTDLREIARGLGVPVRILDKPPSAGLWEGQTDEGELGITYDELDLILKSLASGRKPDAGPEMVARVRRMIETSRHKRSYVPRFDPESSESYGCERSGDVE